MSNVFKKSRISCPNYSPFIHSVTVLAVKCINGTFVGRKNDNVIAYKGIPFVGKQPVGELRRHDSHCAAK